MGVLLVFNNDEEPTEKLTDDEFFTNLADGKVTFIEVEQRKSVIEISGRLAGYKKDQYFVVSVPNSETSLDRMNNAAEEHDIKKWSLHHTMRQADGSPCLQRPFRS